MESEFSWLVLVLAFAAITGGCVLLLARLRRIASAGGADASRSTSRGDTARPGTASSRGIPPDPDGPGPHGPDSHGPGPRSPGTHGPDPEDLQTPARGHLADRPAQ